MTVSGIGHVNIRTRDLAGTIAFYTRIVGLAYDGPDEVGGFVRHWLRDADGRAIVHLRDLAPSGDTTGAVDHVALDCADKAAMLARLAAAGIVHAVRDDLAGGVTQVFVTDPNGLALELVFPLPAAGSTAVACP